MRAAIPTGEKENMMMFTDSEDDSVESDEDMPVNDKRLVQVFWRTRNWIILQNTALLKLFLKQRESAAIIYTPISPEGETVTGQDRSMRWASLETKLENLIKNLHQGMNIIEGTQPLMMQFLRYVSYDKSSIPENFLLPLEQKLILFNEDRQRQLKDERDKGLLVGAFLYIKVMAGKLFFKPYKLTRFFDTEVSALENPILFKENCLAIAYTFIAMFTDYAFDLYKVEMERIEGRKLNVKADIARVKQ